MNKRFIAARLASIAKLDLLPRIINRFKQRPIPVLAYHRVMDVDDSFPFDKGLISASVAQFREQMEYVKEHFTALSMSEYIEMVHGRTKAIKNGILITFDDGFDDNYLFAFPILRELNIPATFFVTTDFINSRTVLWYEELAYFFNKTDSTYVDFSELQLSFELNTAESREKAYEVTVEALKLRDDRIRTKALESLYETYGNPIENAPESDKSLSLPMTWEQARTMFDSNMDIGSHSVNHPILSKLDSESIEFEMVASKQILEQQLNCDILSVAYPVGQSSSVNKEVTDYARLAGYSVGFNYIDSVNQLDLYNIGRIHVETCHSIHHFKSRIYFPSAFCE